METTQLIRTMVGLLALVGLPGCADDPKSDGSGGETYDPMIDAAEFSTTIDNPFLPWTPGMELRFVEDEVYSIVITVTDEVRTVMGVDCVVVHDQLTDADGAIVEDTFDWYAQDSAGNVWYFGEETVEYDEQGNPDPAGSWEAGIDGALPGIAMPADPVAGEPYRQEFLEGEAEDWGQIIEVDVDITVPAGSYTGCLKTKDWSGLHPTTDIENKIYCPGVGNVKAEVVEGGVGLEELTEATVP